MADLPAIAADDERLAVFATVRDLFRYAVSRFNAAGLAYGHGATNAVDEAAFIVLEGLKLPIDALDPFLDARLTRAERARLLALIDARVATRKPAAYLLNRAYIQGVPFYVDERVIVPRSFIGELLFHGLVGPGALIDDAGRDRKRARSLHRRRLAGDSRRARLPQRDDRRRRTLGRRARGGAPQRRGARPRRPGDAASRATCSRRSAASATTSSSPIRPMSTPNRSPPFRPNTPPSRDSRTPAGAMGSTSCGASSPRRARI